MGYTMRRRKFLRRAEYDYSQDGLYFVTICTWRRIERLGRIASGKCQLDPDGAIVEKWWRKIPTKYPHVALDEFVIMPDHLHGLISLVGLTHVSAHLQKSRYPRLFSGSRPCQLMSQFEEIH